MKLFKPLAISIILWGRYPLQITRLGNKTTNWCVLDFLAYVPNAIGSYTHDLYEAEAAQVEDRMEDVQQLMFQLGEKTSAPIATIAQAREKYGQL